MKLIRLSEAARLLGVHPVTVRRWSDAGKLKTYRPGDQRRFDEDEVLALAGVEVDKPTERREGLYVRVSGSAGQETSLATQEEALRASSTGTVARVYKDKSSGLRENRPGLTKLLADARAGKINVVRVTHEDRLARFGVEWLRQLLERDGVQLEVLNPKKNSSPTDELVADFMSLVTSFAGRLYGLRSKEAKAKLLEVANASSES